ncbi:unnamed protein product, partial [marine sediment metagenome]
MIFMTEFDKIEEDKEKWHKSFPNIKERQKVLEIYLIL